MIKQIKKQVVVFLFELRQILTFG